MVEACSLNNSSIGKSITLSVYYLIAPNLRLHEPLIMTLSDSISGQGKRSVGMKIMEGDQDKLGTKLRACPLHIAARYFSTFGPCRLKIVADVTVRSQSLIRRSS